MLHKKKFLLFCIIINLFSGCTTENNININRDSDVVFCRKCLSMYGFGSLCPASYPILYYGGVEITASMLNIIDNAQNYIIINSFLIVNDRHGQIILDRLIEKHRSGVDVYVMTDSSSNFMGFESGISYLKKNNVPCTEFNPIKMHRFVNPVNLFYRNHSKYWIIDGRQLFIGGVNIIGTSLKSMEENGNTDLMVLISSPEIIRELLETFILNWNSYSSVSIEIDDFFIAEDCKTDTEVLLINQNDPKDRSAIRLMMELLVDFAENEVWLLQPYTFLDKNVVTYIRILKNKNVSINIILSRYVQNKKFHYASFYGIKNLINEGVNVWIYEKKSPLHCKMFIIDNKIFSIGSANFNKRSMELSTEVNLVFYDEKSCSILNRCFLDIRKHIRKVNSVEAEKYRTIKYRFWHMLMKYGG